MKTRAPILETAATVPTYHLLDVTTRGYFTLVTTVPMISKDLPSATIMICTARGWV